MRRRRPGRLPPFAPSFAVLPFAVFVAAAICAAVFVVAFRSLGRGLDQAPAQDPVPSGPSPRPSCALWARRGPSGRRRVVVTGSGRPGRRPGPCRSGSALPGRVVVVGARPGTSGHVVGQVVVLRPVVTSACPDLPFAVFWLHLPFCRFVLPLPFVCCICRICAVCRLPASSSSGRRQGRAPSGYVGHQVVVVVRLCQALSVVTSGLSGSSRQGQTRPASQICLPSFACLPCFLSRPGSSGPRPDVVVVVRLASSSCQRPGQTVTSRAPSGSGPGAGHRRQALPACQGPCLFACFVCRFPGQARWLSSGQVRLCLVPGARLCQQARPASLGPGPDAPGRVRPAGSGSGPGQGVGRARPGSGQGQGRRGRARASSARVRPGSGQTDQDPSGQALLYPVALSFVLCFRYVRPGQVRLRQASSSSPSSARPGLGRRQATSQVRPASFCF